MLITNLLLFVILIYLAQILAVMDRIRTSARISTVTISDGSGTGRTATVLDDGSILATCKEKSK